MQHTAILAGGDFFVRLLRLLQGNLFGDFGHRTQGGSARAQSLQVRLRDLHRRDFARP
ncbi:hypothetical protein HRbin16_03270 [bacterium HR16]|nr:hypothetical protein HRbin16_03270 [bacterium HR16]